jgi:hypothetical protein
LRRSRTWHRQCCRPPMVNGGLRRSDLVGRYERARYPRWSDDSGIGCCGARGSGADCSAVPAPPAPLAHHFHRRKPLLLTWTGYYRGRLPTKLRRLQRVGDPPQLPCFARLPSFVSASFRKSKSFALAVCANFLKSDAPIPFGFAPTAQRPKIHLRRRI